MKPKKVNVLFVLVGLLAVSACAGGGAKHYLGRTLEPGDVRPLEAASGEHTHTSKAFKTNYQYAVDEENDLLILNGTITSVLDPTKHPLGAVLTRMQYEDVIVTVLFTDTAGKVVDAGRVHLYPRYQMFYPVPFKRTFAYKPAYRGIALRITAYMLDGITRMRSRQINAFDTLESGGYEGTDRSPD